MRKRTINSALGRAVPNDSNWLQLEQIASIEISSEDPAHPIENALLPDLEMGWRAAHPGKQTLRLVFDRPQQINRVWLRFVETGAERAQEFVLRWMSEDEKWHEIVRQQWNFGAGDSSQEIEDYSVELMGVAVLELTIVPDRNGGNAHASLAQLRLA